MADAENAEIAATDALAELISETLKENRHL